MRRRLKRTRTGFLPTILMGLSIPLIGMTAFDAAGSSAQPVGAAVQEDQIAVFVDGELFTAYRTEQAGQGHKYPFLYPVIGPASGQDVTTYDQEPWPHHSSLFIGLDHVSSQGIRHANYWQPREALETGRIYATNPRIIEATGQKVVLADDAQWRVAEHDPHLRDRRRITIHAPSAHVRVLDFVFEFEVLQDLTVGTTTHAMFAARMHPDLAVDAGGTILDADGNEGEQETRGNNADWVAYFNERDGTTEGLAIIQHADNPYYPAPWFTRDYGFFSPNPVWQEQRQWDAGKKFTKRYRVIVFAGSVQEAEVERWAKEFME